VFIFAGIRNCSQEALEINILQRCVGKISNRFKESQYCNPYDREIIEALERLLILKDETDSYSLKILRYGGVIFVVTIIMRIFFGPEGGGEVISDYDLYIFSCFFFILYISYYSASRIFDPDYCVFLDCSVVITFLLRSNPKC